MSGLLEFLRTDGDPGRQLGLAGLIGGLQILANNETGASPFQTISQGLLAGIDDVRRLEKEQQEADFRELMLAAARRRENEARARRRASPPQTLGPQAPSGVLPAPRRTDFTTTLADSNMLSPGAPRFAPITATTSDADMMSPGAPPAANFAVSDFGGFANVADAQAAEAFAARPSSGPSGLPPLQAGPSLLSPPNGAAPPPIPRAGNGGVDRSRLQVGRTYSVPTPEGGTAIWVWTGRTFRQLR